jgi:hypothetical protein
MESAMQALDKSLRNTFEKTILKARSVAEDAATAALGEIGVAEPIEASYLSLEKKELRKKLRAHARQLGDEKASDGTQGTDRLVEEIAYEHWHRMLFARFLAENELLMYPDPVSPVAVTLADCDDLAKEEGTSSGWELAARYAARMLPQIFRPDSPVFSLVLPPEYQQKLEALVKELPKDIFTASDSLGWAYQFWQTDNKEKINKSEVKIGARELPAVTQLFTEPYMVSFLLDNSLGAWWAARRLSEDDLKNAATEEELRKKASLPGVPLEYLRFIKTDDGVWTPAAGTFEKWPEHLKDFKSLDPCCGSGHFLVALLQMLVPLRMEMESISAREAVDLVLSENIHGLELDSRCVELAAFALAFAAWRYPDAGRYRVLPTINVACSGLAVTGKKAEWKALARGNTNLELALGGLHDLFADAPVLGSLIDPAVSEFSNLSNLDSLSQTLSSALGQGSTEADESAITAKGLATAAQFLSAKYTFVITNVPYLGRGNQVERLQEFCTDNYSEAKSDLATVFLERCLKFCAEGGSTSIVLPQNWLFLTTYRKFREKLLKTDTWHLIARLGPGAFDSISGEVVKAILISLSRGNAQVSDGGLFASGEVGNFIRGVDVSDLRGANEKAQALPGAEVKTVEQKKQFENPDARVVLDDAEDVDLLSKFAEGIVGLQTGDDPRYVCVFWEYNAINSDIWEYLQNTPDTIDRYTGMINLVRWDRGKGPLLSNTGSRPTQGLKAVGKEAIAIHRMQVLVPYIFSKQHLHQNVAILLPHNPVHLPAIWCFCSSPEYNEAVRRIDQKLNVTNATLVKVPFDLERWTKLAEEQYPKGLPKPYTNDPTQWIFHGHPCGSVFWDDNSKWTAMGDSRIDDTVLQVAAARLLGYHWPAELDPSMELADEQRALVNSCESLLKFADKDGIVCIPAVRGERSAADRLLDLLVAAYGSAWKRDILGSLLAASDHAGKTLETWLRDKFFAQHCKLFQHRPFIWQIWDGLKDGFSALVNYHTLDYKKLETLIYTYLGDWISRQKLDLAKKVDDAQEKIDAAERLKKKLELILQGEAPYDIFVRWKPLAEQSIGWNPDLNDGVRLNIRPFITAEVLRFNKKPQINIKWDKDRGKDVETAPWYKTFGGERINDHHLTLEEKMKAREGK